MHINQLTQCIQLFPEIETMNDNALIVIGGMTAMHLHGLRVRESSEVDIIVYEPSADTISYLERICGNETGSRSHINGEDRRSYKIEREGMVVDFLLEETSFIAPGLLEKKIGDYSLCVQSIGVILDAKRSYNREKDWKDFNDIIVDNLMIHNVGK